MAISLHRSVAAAFVAVGLAASVATVAQGAASTTNPCEVVSLDTLAKLTGTTFQAGIHSSVGNPSRCLWNGPTRSDSVSYAVILPGLATKKPGAKAIVVNGFKGGLKSIGKGTSKVATLEVRMGNRGLSLIGTGKAADDKVMVALASAIAKNLGDLKPPIP